VCCAAIHLTAIGRHSEPFPELLDRAASVYEQRGRVRVAFTEVRAEPVSDVSVHVFVKIDEGRATT
jgi:hypothetical protein